MESPAGHPPMGEHDWHSAEYVAEWISRDITRDDERRPLLARMVALAPFPRDAALEVLDVGAGYGLVSEEVFRRFPNARVTLQDYSAPMFEHARARLAANAPKIRCVLTDLTDPAWASRVGGPFDLVVSGLAIHNLRASAAMSAVYGAIHGLLKPGGLFLDYDLAGLAPGGIDSHLRWLAEAGFQHCEAPWRDDQSPAAILIASR